MANPCRFLVSLPRTLPRPCSMTIITCSFRLFLSFGELFEPCKYKQTLIYMIRLHDSYTIISLSVKCSTGASILPLSASVSVYPVISDVGFLSPRLFDLHAASSPLILERNRIVCCSILSHFSPVFFLSFSIAFNNSLSVQCCLILSHLLVGKRVQFIGVYCNVSMHACVLMYVCVLRGKAESRHSFPPSQCVTHHD